jgi:hypothetical protein
MRRASDISAWSFAFFAAISPVYAQFKVVGPAPYPPAVAHQKIRNLLEAVNPANRQQTVDTLTGLLSWYRDILDDELIAAWRKDSRANLTEVVGPLADSRVAVGVVEFSWREQRPLAFLPAYAPMFQNLLTRFPESAQPFLDDLLGARGQPAPDLSQPEAEAVCRILLDMPDIGTWRKSALEILPHYRRVAESLLAQDLHGSDREASYRAQRWLADLKADAPARTTLPRTAVSDSAPVGGSARTSAPAPPPLPRAVVPPAPLAYDGAQSGTLESRGGPIPQNAEYVFRDVPLGKLQLDYDTKTWDARLAPGDGQTQRLIIKNKSSGPQKRCVVHWSVIP